MGSSTSSSGGGDSHEGCAGEQLQLVARHHSVAYVLKFHDHVRTWS